MEITNIVRHEFVIPEPLYMLLLVKTFPSFQAVITIVPYDITRKDKHEQQLKFSINLHSSILVID